MRRDVRWAIGLGAGALVGGASWLLAGSPHLALGTGLVFVIATALFVRANEQLQARADWDDSRTGLGWMTGFVVLGVVPGSVLQEIAGPASLAELMAVGLFVFGIAVGSLAVGIGLTLTGLDDGEPAASERAEAA